VTAGSTWSHEILRTLCGSSVHGLSVSDQDDRDEMGLCVEPCANFLRLRPARETWTHRSQPEGARSGPGDTDLVVYGLAKWARLALAGNPTVLIPLFAPESAIITCDERGRELRAMADAFAGQHVRDRFLGYLRHQQARLDRDTGKPHRPELVARFGYDTKYAGHILRLGYQGLELLKTGRLTLPMAEPIRTRIVQVRTGQVSEAEFRSEARDVEIALERETASHLPAGPDIDRVEAFVVATYLEAWS